MQKADAIRRMKWAAEDAYLRSVGVKNAMTGWNFWEEVNSMNRERPGGIQTQYMSGWDDWKKSKYAKRRMNKKLRREQKQITIEALRELEEDRELWLQEMAAEWDDEGLSLSDMMNDYVSEHPHYFEDEYDPWWDEQNFHMMEDMDFDYGFPV